MSIFDTSQDQYRGFKFIRGGEEYWVETQYIHQLSLTETINVFYGDYGEHRGWYWTISDAENVVLAEAGGYTRSIHDALDNALTHYEKYYQEGES